MATRRSTLFRRKHERSKIFVHKTRGQYVFARRGGLIFRGPGGERPLSSRNRVCYRITCRHRRIPVPLSWGYGGHLTFYVCLIPWRRSDRKRLTGRALRFRICNRYFEDTKKMRGDIDGTRNVRKAGEEVNMAGANIAFSWNGLEKVDNVFHLSPENMLS